MTGGLDLVIAALVSGVSLFLIYKTNQDFPRINSLAPLILMIFMLVGVYAQAALPSSSYPMVVDSGAAYNQTGSALLLNYTATNGTYEIGGYINLLHYTAGGLSMVVNYTNPSGAFISRTIPISDPHGTVAASLTSVADASAAITTIEARANTIDISIQATAFNGSYNGYGYITQVN